MTAIEGRDHDQRFYVACRVAGLGATIDGVGGSRRKAEQDAASKALEVLRDQEQG